MKTIFKFLRQYKLLCIFTIIFIIFDILGALYIPTITANMINSGLGNKDINYIIKEGIIMLVVTIISGLGALLGSYLCSRLASNMGRDMRNALYKKSLKFSHFDFKQFGTGSMITRTLNDVNVIQQTAVSFIQMVIPVPIMCISGIVMAFKIDKYMGFLLFGITVLIIIVATLITSKATIIFEKLQLFLDKMNVILRENITGVRVIRAFNKEDYEKNRLKDSFEKYAESAITANRLFAGLDSLAFFTINICIVAILYIGGNRVGVGAMEIGNITAVTEYAILILFYLIMAQMELILMPRASICLKRITEVLETEPEIQDGKAKAIKSTNDDVICFKNMTFRFLDADEDTLSNLKFTCKKGQTTAIIGSTGSGKSTIAKLIMRFHDTTKGSILLNGQNLKSLSQKEIKEHISYVPQKAWLFSGTIADNLKYGNENATEGEMYHALEVAQAGFVEELEDGLQTRVAQGGTNFSGGQKQRLAIARALIKKADLYIFDDSFSERLSLKLRKQISNKLNVLPLSYFDKHKPGEILSKATNDLDKMSEAIQTGLLTLFTSIGTVIGSIIMMMYFNVMFSVIFIIFMIISLGLTKVFTNKTLKYAINRQEQVEKLTAQVEEAYSGRIIIQSFNQEEKSINNMSKITNEVAKATRKADFIMYAINPAIRFINRLGQVVITILAGKALIEGKLTVGGFQAFFTYLNQAAEPLTEASYMINSLQSALASVERIYEMLDEEEISKEPEEPDVVDNARGEVEFKNIKFGYSPDKLLMENISFNVKKGQKVAIVGNTGAGKTTLINLLMRFYDINGGKILLDGKDTKNITRANLRNNFGMVLQDTWLFEGTVAENIAYGRPDATREEIIEAAKMARVDFFIRTMPKGYDTVLSNDTEGISVGQRQLLTIARVMLRNPSVLILDEATSSVDTRTEIEIGKAMQNLMKNRTSFVIAHRLSTIVDSDMIFVMKKGTIIEQGNHKQLIEKNGAYAELYNSQFA